MLICKNVNSEKNVLKTPKKYKHQKKFLLYICIYKK